MLPYNGQQQGVMGWSNCGPSGPKAKHPPTSDRYFRMNELATAGGNHPLLAGMRVTFDVGLNLFLFETDCQKTKSKSKL